MSAFDRVQVVVGALQETVEEARVASTVLLWTAARLFLRVMVLERPIGVPGHPLRSGEGGCRKAVK